MYLCCTSTSDYRPALSSVSVTADFSERLSTFTYSFQESCSLYPRCPPYFSVEHTVSPQSVVSNSFSGCSVEYTIHNLMRCVSYQSTATALLGNQRGISIVVGSTVMQSEWLQLIWGGWASKLDWGLAFTSPRHNTYCLMDICNKRIVQVTRFFDPFSSKCVSHFVCGHFPRSRSIYYHQCFHWSGQKPHQSDLHWSESCYYI